MGAIVPSRPSGVLAALDQFMREEFAKFGRRRPVVPRSTSAGLLTVAIVCSHPRFAGKPFPVAFGQDVEGERYHVKSLEPTYTQLLASSGYALENPDTRALRMADVDWMGFQCFYCGNEGAFYCGDHDGWVCGNRIEQIHGGGIKCFCPICRTWEMLGDERPDTPVSGFHFDAHGPREAQAAPAPTFPTIRHTPASASVGSPLIGGYGTSLVIRPGGR